MQVKDPNLPDLTHLLGLERLAATHRPRSLASFYKRAVKCKDALGSGKLRSSGRSIRGNKG